MGGFLGVWNMATHTASHSPGPFTTVRGKQKHREAVFIKSGPDFIGKVYGHEGQPVKANAALLSSAPDLLTACEAAMPFCTAHWADCTCGGGGADPHCERHALADQLRAAIAKAHGTT
jgi:hypothetical protein